MKKYYCDHCGAEITEKRNNVECTMYSDAGAGVFHRGEFCDKCSDILSSFFCLLRGACRGGRRRGGRRRGGRQ